MSTNSLDNFEVQEIELKTERIILEIKNLKKKEKAFLKQSYKRLKGKASKSQFEKIESNSQKLILLVKGLKNKKEIESEKCFQAFDDYLKIKNKRIGLLVDLEVLSVKIIERRKRYKPIAKWNKVYAELYKIGAKLKKAFAKLKKAEFKKDEKKYSD